MCKYFFLITHIRILILVAVFIVCCLVKINYAKPTQVKFEDFFFMIFLLYNMNIFDSALYLIYQKSLKRTFKYDF